MSSINKKNKILTMFFLSFFLIMSSCVYDPYTHPSNVTVDSSSWGTPLKEIWKVKKATYPGVNTDPGDSHARTTPYIFGERIIFGYDSVIECLDKNTGTRIWQFFSDPYWNGQTKPFWDATDFIIENGKLYALMGESKLVCLDQETGKKVWLYDIIIDQAGRGFSKYSQSQDAIFITLYDTHYMVAISKTTGLELWRTKIPFTDYYFGQPEKYFNPGPAVYNNGRVFCGFAAPGIDTITKLLSYRAGGLIGFDAITGALIFFKTLPRADSTINFPQWKELVRNNTDQAIFPYKNYLVFSSEYYFEKTDLDGNIIWRSIPTYGPGAGQVGTDIPQVMYNDRIYGICNGGYDAWGYSLDPETGKIFWTGVVREADNSMTTTSINGIMTDGIGLYKVSDINGLIGLDLHTGKTIWDSRLGAHIHSPVDFNVSGGVAVDSNRVYFLSVDSIFCMQRTDK